LVLWFTCFLDYLVWEKENQRAKTR
jgi:hypothetical protein